jgi:hypothetical protein
MRLRLTLFLLLLNIALFGYLYYLEQEPDTTLPSRLVFAPGLIEQTVGIAIAGAEVVHPWSATREGNRWLVEEPLRWPANPYAVQRLLDLLRTLRWETRFSVREVTEAGRELADYGLGDNATVLRLRTEERALEVRVGTPTEVGSRLYLLAPDGREIFVVNRAFLQGMDLSPESLVARSILSIPPFETRSVFVQGGENGSVRVELAREGESWVLRAPIRVAASDDAVNAALEAVFQVQVGDFVEATPREHGLSNPFLRLNLNGNNRQQTLLLGDRRENPGGTAERYAKLEALPAIFTVPAAPFEVWETAQESLRERRFMAFDPAEASAVEIRLNDRALNLQRLESGRWQLVSTGDDGNLQTVFADAGVMEDLLERLRALEALRFESDAPSNDILEQAGLRDPQRRVTVRLRNDRSLNLLLGGFARENGGEERVNRLFAKRENSASIYVTTASILGAVPLNPLHYRERVAGTLPGGAILETIRLRDLAAGVNLLEARATGEGFTAETALSPETIFALEAVAGAFRRFPVRRFLHDEFSDPLVLDAQTQLPWAFALEADYRLSGGGEEAVRTRRYVLTERLGGLTQFVGSAELDLVFTLPLELIDALHPILFNRPRPDATVNPEPVEPAPPLTPAPPPDEATAPGA